MQIDHAESSGGRVQLLFGSDGGDKAEIGIGILVPGDYDFGKAEIRQTIRVITGVLRINTIWYQVGEECSLERGIPIRLESNMITTFVLRYL